MTERANKMLCARINKGIFLVSFLISLITILFSIDSSYSNDKMYEQAITKLKQAKTEREYFYALNHAAKESMNVGRRDDARKYALELQNLLPKYKNDWNYGNAVQDVHIVLGRLALAESSVEEAKKHLIEAGKSPGSPQMDSFGPNMTLAKELLERGEKNVVLKYFDLCSKFWEDDFGKLKQWKKEVERGVMPDFGANLLY
jgi:tetratricopeptide (TPR) repeat protein